MSKNKDIEKNSNTKNNSQKKSNHNKNKKSDKSILKWVVALFAEIIILGLLIVAYSLYYVCFKSGKL